MSGDRLERDLKTVPAQHGRVDASCDVAQLFERERDLAPRLIQPRRRFSVAREALFQQGQLERQGDQPLLRTVVEAPLQPLTLLLSGVDQPPARPAQLLEPSPQFSLQAGVLDCDAGGRGHPGEQLGLVLQ